MPKEAFDALMQQLSTLQATVDRLTAIIEEKNQIILNQQAILKGSGVCAPRPTHAERPLLLVVGRG